MTALSEALAAAQRAALAALGKRYVAEPIEAEELHAILDAMGCTDKVEQVQLVAAWETLRQTGTGAPTAKPEPAEKPSPDHEPASDAQWGFIRQLCREKNLAEPDTSLTKTTASQVIDQLKDGSYDPAKWSVPF